MNDNVGGSEGFENFHCLFAQFDAPELIYVVIPWPMSKSKVCIGQIWLV